MLLVISLSHSTSQRWSAMTLQNKTLVLDSSSTTTGSHGMNLVLRKGVLRNKDSYNFTLHVTDGSLDGDGAASITLHHNMPPDGGECHLRGGGETGVEYRDKDSERWRIRTLLDRVHFNCSGRKLNVWPRSHIPESQHACFTLILSLCFFFIYYCYYFIFFCPVYLADFSLHY